MEKVGNINVYFDDEEIIEILKELPSFKDFDNMNILKYMQERTIKSDFGAVMGFNNIIYTIYKFNQDLIATEDAGLIMTSSNSKYVIEQLNMWNHFRNVGMSFSEKIFEVMINGLISSKADQMFYSKRN